MMNWNLQSQPTTSPGANIGPKGIGRKTLHGSQSVRYAATHGIGCWTGRLLIPAATKQHTPGHNRIAVS